MEKRIILPDEQATQKIAQQLAQLALPTDCITLSGDLGSGKTTFARAFIQAIAGDVTVQSPTFLLVQPYEYTHEGKSHTLQHMDLYRIEHESELIELGFEELLAEHLCLIEWPEIAKIQLPDHLLEIHFTHLPNNERELKLLVKADWQDRLNQIYF